MTYKLLKSNLLHKKLHDLLHKLVVRVPVSSVIPKPGLEVYAQIL